MIGGSFGLLPPQGVSWQEGRFIADRLVRNQLTGSVRFVDEIERRTGTRVEARLPGRSKNKSVPIYAFTPSISAQPTRHEKIPT